MDSNVVAFPKSMTTREAVEVVVGVDRESVMEFINALTPEQVAIFALRVDAVRRLLADARTYAYMRLDQGTNPLVGGHVGRKFTDPDTGIQYLFRSRGRKRVIPDYQPFLRALSDANVTLLDLAPWLSKGDAFKLATMEQSGDQKVADVVEEFCTWDDAPPSLLELDEKGRIKR